MVGDVKEPVNFRLGRKEKQALAAIAAEQDKALGELIREVVEAYLQQVRRGAWEAEARRASLALAQEAKDPASAEAENLRMLEANLEEFAKEWVWEGDT